MYFEVDATIHASTTATMRRTMVRVEHYGKGAPPWASQYVASRPVPAVTGAFLSVDRGWFEKLGGFSEDYVFGDYEDADLCLKSLLAGTPAWLHDNRMWHLEGRGAERVPQHEGGALVNRWHFARTWTATIVPDLLGRTPRHRLLRASAEAPAHQAPAHQANERDTLPGAAAPTGRAKPRDATPTGATKLAPAKQRGAQSNGGALVQRARQRGIKPVPAGAPLHPSSRRPR
jgi:GT2 family glycosyltransferase